MQEWKDAVLRSSGSSESNPGRIVFTGINNPRTGTIEFYANVKPMAQSTQEPLDITI